MNSLSMFEKSNNYSTYLKMLELSDLIDAVEERSDELMIEMFRSKSNEDEDDAPNDNVEDEDNSTQDGDKQNKPKIIDNPYRGLKNAPNPLDAYSDEELIKEYKISRKTIYDVVELLKDDLMYLSNRGSPMSPLVQFLIALRYLTTGTRQKNAMSGVSQSSSSRIIAKLTSLLAKHSNTFIKFPPREEMQRVKSEFYQMGKFPETIGCIGTTHVSIKVEKNKNGHVSHIFGNERGFLSLRVQLVIGPNGEIYDVDSRSPGSIHENNIYELSDVNIKQTALAYEGVFIGSDAYNPTTSIMTSVKTPQLSGEYYYNDALAKTYGIFYDSVNTWKRRFKCLQSPLSCRFPTQQNVIRSCAIIHNMALQNQDVLALEDQQSPVTDPYNKKRYMRRIDIPAVTDNTVFMERQDFIARHFPVYYNDSTGSYHYV